MGKEARCRCKDCTGHKRICTQCGLEVYKSDEDGHRSVCIGRRVDAPFSIVISPVMRLGRVCSLIGLRRLGSSIFGDFFRPWLLGEDSWKFPEVICPTCQILYKDYTAFMPRAELRAHIAHYHRKETICEVCGEGRIPGHTHICQVRLNDYVIACPAGCGAHLLRSEYPHKNCPVKSRRALGASFLSASTSNTVDYYNGDDELES